MQFVINILRGVEVAVDTAKEYFQQVQFKQFDYAAIELIIS